LLQVLSRHYDDVSRDWGNFGQVMTGGGQREGGLACTSAPFTGAVARQSSARELVGSPASF